MTQDVATLEQEAQSLTVQAEGLKVTDAASFERASEFIKSIATYMKRVGDVLDPIVTSAWTAHKVAVAQRDTLLRPAQGAKRILGERMATWEQEQARLRREAEARAQREREQAEREARERAAIEQRRLQDEAEERRLAEAAELEARGDTAGAERLISEPVTAPVVVTPAPVFAPQPPVAVAPKVDGVSFRTDWDFEIVDANLIPREYLIPDEKKIRGVVKAMRGAARIPGVRPFEKRITSVRS
jgi:hypothetical protein